MLNCGIYKITNTITGDFYIGQSVDLNKRNYTHFWELTKGIHHNVHLQRTYNKYGKENFRFEILLYCEPFELTRYEQGLVDKLNPAYNIHKECVDSTKGIKFSEETKRKISEAEKGNKKHFGHKHSEESKLRMSEIKKGKITSEETKLKMSISKKGKIFSEEHKRKIGEAHKGKFVSEETRKKQSDAKKNISEETRLRMSIAQKLRFSKEREKYVQE